MGGFFGFVTDAFCIESGRRLSTLAKWSFIQGGIYIVLGLLMEFFPALFPAIFLSDQKKATEGWFRAFGFAVFYIGLFYVFAGIADNSKFAAASIIMRIIIVPGLFVVPLYCMEAIPGGMAVFFGIADPTLAIMTLILYYRQHQHVTTVDITAHDVEEDYGTVQ
ncbi:unnamed protein product [Amoebophrya sp. A25]|nr:unnamed protein product [Amoebophrya sp. A25]|eukprot:GSA25T00022902001.1